MNVKGADEKVQEIYLWDQIDDVYNNSSVVYIDSIVVNVLVCLFTKAYTC